MRNVVVSIVMLFAACSSWAVVLRSDEYASISAAVSACVKMGGGKVVVPDGEWETGAVHLQSNVELHLERGAILRFSDDPKAYLPAVRVSWEGLECCNLSPLVYAYGATNVSITGEGRLEPKMTFWRNWFGAVKPQTRALLKKLESDWVENEVPVEKRRLCGWPESAFRPQLIHFNNCKNVRLDGFSVRGTPFWTIHLYCCDGALVRNLDVSAFPADEGRVANNSDGIDIDSSSNVHVLGCSFRQGDDAIVIKSGRDQDGRRLGRPAENVLIEDCIVKAGHVLLGIGSELSGGVRNVTMRNCRVDGTAHRLLFIKTNRLRGAFVENICLENIVADVVDKDVLAVITSYPGAAGVEIPRGLPPTLLSGISVSNVVCRTVGSVANVWGDPLSPVRKVSVRDVRVDKVRGNVIDIENATDVVTAGIVVRKAPDKPLRDDHW